MAIRINRRTALKGIGTAITLPFLDAMRPWTALAGDGPADLPLRMGFLYVPNGIHMADWTPTAEGAGYELPKTLQPLAPLKDDFSVLTGLAQQKAFANGDGPGDHARALTTFLTGCQARKTDGADIRAGVSVDQVAAAHIGRQTRFPSVEIGCDAGGQSGNCDSGYSCAYSANIAWRTDTQPIPKEVDPKLIFERLFTIGRPGETESARAEREKYNRSILDLVEDDARRLQQRLGVTDRRKLDEYLTALRELEVRIERLSKSSQGKLVDLPKPSGIPEKYDDHLRLLADLMVLAWQTDTTRVSTFVFANEGSNRSYPFLEIPEGHHELSHHEGKEEKQAKLQRINQFHAAQFAYLLEKMKSVREGEGTLLDRSMIVYGSGIGDGNRHNHDDLPIILAGRGGGSIQPGRHIKYEDGTPLTNLYLSMLDRAGIDWDQLGDSSGRLTGLDG